MAAAEFACLRMILSFVSFSRDRYRSPKFHFLTLSPAVSAGVRLVCFSVRLPARRELGVWPLEQRRRAGFSGAAVTRRGPVTRRAPSHFTVEKEGPSGLDRVTAPSGQARANVRRTEMENGLVRHRLMDPRLGRVHLSPRAAEVSHVAPRLLRCSKSSERANKSGKNSRVYAHSFSHFDAACSR